jgi:hypothetical protein
VAPGDDSPFGPEPFVVPIEDALDLHAFAPREIPGVVSDYLEAAAEAGFRASARRSRGSAERAEKSTERERAPLFAVSPP